MDPIEPFISAFRSIKSSKTRSFLTTLGILIAVAAVIINISIGTGQEEYQKKMWAEWAAPSPVFSITPNEGGLFTDRELDAVRRISGVAEVSPEISTNSVEVKFMGEKKKFSVYGVTKDYQQVENLTLEEGVFLSDDDRNAAVLGYDVAHVHKKISEFGADTFSRNISIRSTIEITVTRSNGEEQTKTFSVKGILINESRRYPNPNTNIYIPESTLSEMLDKKGYTIQVRAENANEVGEVREDIKHRLDRLLGFTKYSREERPYNTPKSLGELVGSGMGEMEKAAKSFTNMLLSIALVSLLVGAIGIMNIMFVTVTERTREVGLMKAVGATRFDVLITFLVESAMLGLIGGALGVAVGIGFCKFGFISPEAPPVTPPEWIFIGFAVAVAVGIASGFYPAYKAARMKPLEALRYE